MPNPNFPNNPGYNLYVGARYVPAFANPIEWDKSKTYEPLTVVTYQGNSFTSKTYVPANTDITNTTFWALTGNYNAQVEQYRQEVAKLQEAFNSSKVYITPDDYGAVGDGVTNDTVALKNMFDAANTSGKPVIFPEKKRYVVDDSEEINIMVDTDFNFCEFIINQESNGSIFTIVDPDTAQFTITASNLTRRSVNDNRLYKKSFTIQSPVLLGTTEGGAPCYYKGCFVTDQNGNFTNTEFVCTIQAGTYNIVNCQDADKPFITVKNGVVNYNQPNNTVSPTFISVLRNNVTLEGFTIKGKYNNTNFGDEVFNCNNTSNVTFKNIAGNNPNGPGSGYLVACYTSTNVVVDSVVTQGLYGTSWFDFGSDEIANLVMKNCNMNRFDCHYFYQGNITVKNCVLQLASWSIGNGTMTFEDCTFINTDGTRDRAFGKRNNLFGAENGTVTIKNCVVKGFPYILYWSLNEPPTGESYQDLYGFSGLNIVIDGCVGDSVTNGIARIATDASEGSVYSDKITISARNMKLSTTNNALAGANNINIRAIVENCILNNTGNSMTTLINYCTKAFVRNNELIGIMFNAYGLSNLFLIGNIIEPLATYSVPANAIIVGNIVQADFALQLPNASQHAKANENIFTSEGQTNLASWNDVTK